MKKSEEKRKLVEEMAGLYQQLNVEQLYQLPDHRSSKAWLSEVAAILKNLDESDFQAFLNHRQHLYPSIPVNTRKHAAEQIDGFVRQKVSEYKRYDFSDLDRDGIKFPTVKLPTWLTRNLEKIIVSIIIAVSIAIILTFFNLK